MPQHALQAHVLLVRRSLRLTGVVVRQRAVRLLRHGDRGRQAFADVDDVRVEAARRQEPAERHERGRDGPHGERGRHAASRLPPLRRRGVACRGPRCRAAARAQRRRSRRS